MTRATITKIDQEKDSRNGNSFYRVYFRLEDGSWAKTDLCENYRNWKHWQGLGKVGNILENLIMKNSRTVDADSQPILITSKQEKLL